MANKKESTIIEQPDPVVADQRGTAPRHRLYGFWPHAAIVVLLAIVFYSNTFRHEYALDDTVVIVKNEFVHQGLAGIPDILSKDAYFSYYDQLHSSNQLSGGRYRPLSIVTFAIEQQFFGAVAEGQTDSLIAYNVTIDAHAPYEKKFIEEMHIRHVLNVVWYALAMVVLLYFLRYIVFKDHPLVALVAAILFTIHPLHTEVVANVKSRDEIMSLLFISLTFISAFKYLDSGKKVRWLVAGLLSYFLAFLSKEYAITLVLLLPLSFYIFRKDTVRSSVLSTLPYIVVALIYIAIRWQVIGPRNELSDNDIQINPYALASHTEQVATEIATSLNYLKLLIFPHPLTSDYSYNQIPYKSFSNPLVWLSLVVHIGLFVALFYFLRRRSVLSFAIAFYLLHLLMVNNFLFDIGATMGERLVFHASVGFVIAVAFIISRAVEHRLPIRLRSTFSVGLMVVVIVLCGFKTIDRNRDWKNDQTLFLHDVNTSPNSFLVNVNVGTILVNRSDFEKDETKRKADLRRATQLFSRVLSMQPDYVLGYLNRSISYLKRGMADSMVSDLDQVKRLYPIHPSLPEMYYHAGILYSSNKDYIRAAEALGVSLQLNPNEPAAVKALEEVKMATDAAGTTNKR